MSKLLNAILLFPLLSAGAMARAVPIELGCPAFDAREEGARIRSRAPGLVVRKSAHRLQVTTKAGVQTFDDQPPFDEPFSGVHHVFCERKDGYMLVRVDDNGVFTGKLVDELTGAVTNGGETVLFSNDRRAYLVSEQPDGLDGNVWKVYAVNGKLSWSGYSFIEADKPGYMFASLDTPTWLPSGELSAQATCITDLNRKWGVKLVRKNERWDWAPRKHCPVKVHG